MSTKLTHKLSITIPREYFKVPAKAALEHGIRKAIRIAGGSTSTEGYGQWYDDEDTLVSERVIVITFWYTPAKEGEMLEASAKIITELFALGEDCVMTEKYTPNLGLRAHLLYK